MAGFEKDRLEPVGLPDDRSFPEMPGYVGGNGNACAGADWMNGRRHQVVFCRLLRMGRNVYAG